jgi:hypothetical protein
MILFHRTSKLAADGILANGFRDGEGTYLTTNAYRGVWLSAVPLDENEGAVGDVLLEVDLNLTDTELREWEWEEALKPYREFLIPAKIVNKRGRVRVVDVDEP